MLRAFLVLLVLTAGCAAAPAVGNDPDVAFAAMMIPHHQQALELSALVAGRTTDPTVSDLAFRIDREQVEEIGQLQGLLALRGGAAPTAMHHDMHDMHDMPGMADAATLQGLRSSSGADFDRRWLQTMIAHHEGAITMARDYPGGALTEFARTLTRTQQAEIDRMRGALTSGSAPPAPAPR
ncbi:DUF305 domain-containing protein [Actinomycetospora soli]|uniref:DUF305 domain-containing protein n=1 Tax=Actinomycetospora soli TaxID=2893887 RepID=UPI001E30F2A8|nr:DUF305 domain-containing protein [Actinomycetospora soli]MCD2185978.1 DUF305 domain-containing protein [Actinomycetospora soli]